MSAECPPLETDVEAGDNPYVLALDVGTTTLRCHVYDRTANIKGSGSKRIHILRPQPGYAEIDEEDLWQNVQDVIKETIAACGLEAKDITCMGITNQRNTFITWDRDTGKPFHHFLTWQDLRARDYVKTWNQSYTMRSFNGGAKLLHSVTRQKRFLAAAVLRFMTVQLGKRLNEGKVQFGTIDTWLLWKLTGGKECATDVSNASGTGMFDPFQMVWSSIVRNLVGLPLSILPPIKDTSGVFGRCVPELFGADIPITAMVADQQASMFGQCCFDVGDVKCTMGTGTFINVNTGSKAHASVAGLYPVVGWKIGSEVVYLAEGMASDTGRCVEWVTSLGLCEDISESAAVAMSVEDSGGVYFVPAFSGLQAPINDDTACTSLMGIGPVTSKAHIVRAVLESLAFRFKLLYETALEETRTPFSCVCKVDGGVTNNDFLMQLMADLLQRRIERPKHVDMTSLGAAYLAGLAAGVWKSKEELKALRTTNRVFMPQQNWDKYRPIINQWERAVKRSKYWYQDS